MYEALASLDQPINYSGTYSDISIHETLASLNGAIMFVLFNKPKISIHEALASLDQCLPSGRDSVYRNFNPRGSYKPRLVSASIAADFSNFNPRGSYKPRQQYYTTSIL